MARYAGLDHFRRVVGHRCAGKSVDSVLPSLLRALDLAAEVQERFAVAGWSGSVFGDFFSRDCAVVDPQLRSLWAFRFHPRRLWAAVASGKLERRRRHADGLSAAEPQPTGVRKVPA